MNHFVTIDELKDVTGYKRQGDIENWLQSERIPFFRGKNGRVFTTPEKINEALGGVAGKNQTLEFGYGQKTQS